MKFAVHVALLAAFVGLSAAGLLSNIGTSVNSVIQRVSDRINRTVTDLSNATNVTLEVPECLCAEPLPEPELCNDSSIDAIFSECCTTYAIKGDKFWTLDERGLIVGVPLSVESKWPGISSVDAAYFEKQEGATYIFVGDKVHKFVAGLEVVLEGFPSDLATLFGNITGPVDAAFVSSVDKMLYITKGDQFWRRQSNTTSADTDTGPETLPPVHNFTEGGIDAAFEHKNGVVFAFKGTKYFRLELNSNETTVADPAYPRPTSSFWFGCSRDL